MSGMAGVEEAGGKPQDRDPWPPAPRWAGQQPQHRLTDRWWAGMEAAFPVLTVWPGYPKGLR